MRSARFFMLLILAGVVVFGFCACEKVSDVEKILRGAKIKEVKVTPVQLWTDTGLDLKAGQTVDIKAQGEILINEKDASSPGGLADPSIAPFKKLFWKMSNVTGQAGHGALIGKIGDKGKPFLVGHECKFKADSKGRLYLGVNDKDYHNNSGAYQAKIILK